MITGLFTVLATPLRLTLLLLLLKLIILLANGPILLEESRDILVVAELMRESDAWRQELTWTADPMPPTAAHVIGYPALVKLALTMTGGDVPDAGLIMALLQSLLSCVAVYLMLRCAVTLGIGVFGRWLLLLAAGLGHALFFDLTLTPAGLAAALSQLVLLGITGGFLGLWTLGALPLFLLGVIWAAAVLVSEALLPASLLPLMILLMLGLHRAERAALCLRALALFALPLVLTVAVYGSWNQQRSGSFFLSLSGQMAWMKAPLQMAELGYADPFTGKDMIDSILRDQGRFDADSHRILLRELQFRENLTPLQLETRLQTRFLEILRTHPGAYLRNYMRNVRPDVTAYLLLNPLFNINEMALLSSYGERLLPTTSEALLRLRDGGITPANLAGLLPGGFLRVFAIFAFLAFLAGAPFSYLRRVGKTAQPPSDRVTLAMAGWGAVVATVAVNALFEFTPRDLLYCGTFCLLAVVAYWRHLVNDFLRWRQG